MEKYIVRKEWFGGIVSDVEKYNLKQISKNQYNVIASFLNEESNIRVVDNENIIEEQLSAPLSVTIYPSLKCYQNCTFCYVRKVKETIKSEMTFDSFRIIVDKLKSAGVFDIEIMGGEPLLVPWIIKAINYICVSDIHCSINTNINALNEKFLKEIKNIKNLSLRISIQEYQKDLDKHTKQIFQLLKKLNIKVDILTVIQKKNYDKIHYLVDRLDNSFVKYLIFLYNSPLPTENPEYTTNWFYKITDNLKESFKNTGIKVVAKGPYGNSKYEKDDSKLLEYVDGICNACVSRFEILPDGSVFPCIKYYCTEKDILGNILIEDVIAIWNGKSTQDFRETIKKHKTQNNCVSCTWKNQCSGCIGFAASHNYVVDKRCPKKGKNNEK